MRNPISYIICLLCLTLCSQIQNVYGQNAGIRMGFVNNDSEIKQIDIAVNVLRLVNASKENKKVRLLVNPPAGWQLVGNVKDEIVLAANDSVFVPVRLKPNGALQGNMTYVTNAYVSYNNFTVANAVWNISTEQQSNWSASISSNKVYFIDDADSSSISLHIQNNGNSPEELVVLTNTEQGIYLMNAKKERVRVLSQTIRLKQNADTVLVFPIERDTDKPLPYEAQADELKYRMRVKVINQNPNVAAKGAWSGSADFVKLPHSRKLEESILPSFPLTVQWNSYNILSESTYGSLGLYGNKTLSNNRALTYYYQSSFVNNQINWSSLAGDYLYVGYFSDRYNLEVGDIGAGRSGSALVGKGAKGSVKYKAHQVGAIYISNPSLFETPVLSGFGAFYNYNKDRLKTSAYYESANQRLYGVKTDYGTVDVNYQINNKHTVTLGGGYSKEDYQRLTPISTTGYRTALAYQGTVNKFNLSANTFYHSPSYAPRKGVVSGSVLIAYPLATDLLVRGGVSSYQNNPTYVNALGELVDTLSNGRTNAYVQLLRNNKNDSYVLQPEYILYKSYYLDSNVGGLGFEYRTMRRTDLSFFTSLFLGQNSFLTQTNVEPIFVANTRLAVRYKWANVNVRYYYGPNYLNEQYLYVKTLQNPQRLFGMFYVDYWFAQNTMRLNMNINYNYTTLQSRHQMVTRPELFFYTKSRVELSLYTSYIVYANGEYERSQVLQNSPSYSGVDNVVPASKFGRVEFGFGIKFNINVPAGIDRNYKAKIVVFRDLNGNGVKDANEGGYENMLIRVTKTSSSFVSDELMMQQQDLFELITNERGEVEYNHIPQGNYKIETIPLVASEGWYGGREFYQYIDGNKTISIPLSKGARVSGGIFVERDANTDDKEISLGGIRVTAVNDLTGESHSTLTDQFGNYTMHLPNGSYVVTINEGAVGSRFYFLENNIPVLVRNSGENYSVGFLLVEQKRKINFNNSRGAVQKPSSLRDNRDGGVSTEDADLLPISKMQNGEKVFVVRLYSQEKERMKSMEFDTLQSLTPVFCVVGEGGMYWYYSRSSQKKKEASRLLKKVKGLGFAQAEVLELAAPKKEGERKPEVLPSVKEAASSSRQLITLSTEDEKALYRVLIRSSAILFDPVDFDSEVPGIDKVYVFRKGDLNYYSVGSFRTEKEAEVYQKELKKKSKIVDSKVMNFLNNDL